MEDVVESIGAGSVVEKTVLMADVAARIGDRVHVELLLEGTKPEWERQLAQQHVSPEEVQLGEAQLASQDHQLKLIEHRRATADWLAARCAALQSRGRAHTVCQYSEFCSAMAAAKAVKLSLIHISEPTRPY
eukprot:TRINITY_DN21333_c0_g1_i1.p1 TRINITY_DN21333_c0_g1~~TRINITY_DN21333_c0_g1_i1.p1  ORF type:complete len:132 (+),score=42.01 TRINITY_DN21333_c0_g1_i1:1-396(+)